MIAACLQGRTGCAAWPVFIALPSNVIDQQATCACLAEYAAATAWTLPALLPPPPPLALAQHP